MGEGRWRRDEPGTFSGYCVCVASYLFYHTRMGHDKRSTNARYSTWWQSVDTLPVTDRVFNVYCLNEPLSI